MPIALHASHHHHPVSRAGALDTVPAWMAIPSRCCVAASSLLRCCCCCIAAWPVLLQIEAVSASTATGTLLELHRQCMQHLQTGRGLCVFTHRCCRGAAVTHGPSLTEARTDGHACNPPTTAFAHADAHVGMGRAAHVPAPTRLPHRMEALDAWATLIWWA